MKRSKDVNKIHNVLAVAGSVALSMAVLAAPASAAAPWAGTATHQHPALEKATALGAPAASQVLHIAVALKLQNKQALDQYVEGQRTPGSPAYRQVLTSEQFVANYAPSAAQAQSVVSYLRGQGFTNVSASADRMLVTADGSRTAIESAFNTRLQQFLFNGRTVHINVTDAQVPASLGGTVLSVLGLQNADVAIPLIVHATASASARPLAAAATGHVPVQFPQIYNAGSTPTGVATDIGIIASGNLTGVVTDLRTYETQNGLAQVPVTFVPSATASTDTSGSDEWDLDSQSSTSIAGGVHSIVFYNAPSLSDADLEADFAQVTSSNAVKAINVSLGECESGASTSGFITAADQTFERAVAQGQTFFVSTGDGGAYTGCSAQEGVLTAVGYPASSPYVVAVGGTTLNTNSDGSYASETTWAGAGGGISTVESSQTWQRAVSGNTSRVVPDVTMDADPNSGAEIIVNGSSETVGGTSLAAPLAVGTWARAQSASGNTLGFAAPLIYAAAASTPGAFHDVTSGCNSGNNLIDQLLSLLLGQKNYCASAGFDDATGLGSFNIASFITAVQ